MILKLLGNEMYKLVNRIGNIFIIIGVIFFTFFIVPIQTLIDSDGNYYNGSYSPDEIIGTADSAYQENLIKLQNAEDETARGYYLTKVNACKTLVDNNILIGSWQYNNYFDIYEDALEGVWQLECIKKGYTEEDFRSFYFKEFEHWSVIVGFDDDGNTLVVTKPEALDSPDPFASLRNGTRVRFEVNDSEQLDQCILWEKEIVKKAENCLTISTEEYAEKRIQAMTELIAEEEKARESYQTDMEAHTSDYYLSLRRTALYQKAIECCEILKTCPLDRQSYVLGCIRNISAYAKDFAYQIVVQSRSEFESNGGYDIHNTYDYTRRLHFDSYEDYMEFAQDRDRRFTAIGDYMVYMAKCPRLTYYSPFADNGYHDISFIGDCFFHALNMDIYVVAFVCILLACSIMADEYGSGTARLLLIRPCSRTKIVTAKMLCVVIFGVAMLGAAFSVTYISTLCEFGAEALDPVMLLMKNGCIIEANQPVYCMVRAFLCGIPVLVGVFFGLMLSFVSKRALIGAAGSIPFFFLLSALSGTSWDMLIKYPMLKYTVFPYFMQINNLTDPTNPVFYTTGFPTYLDYGLNLNTGLGVILIHIVVLAAACYVIFNRQEIKQ